MSSEQLMSRLQSQLESRAAAQEAARNGGGDYTGYLSIKFGDQNVFILPPYDATSDLNYEVWVHFGLKDHKGEEGVYKCSKAKHQTCPVCDAIEPLKNATTKEQKDAYESLRAKRQYIYNVLDQTGNNKVLCAKPSQQSNIDAEILATFKVDKTDITNMSNGRWLMITRLKEQPWCRVRTLSQPYALNADQQTAVRAKMRDLKTYYRDYTPVELTKLLKGEAIDPPAATTQGAAPAPAAAPGGFPQPAVQAQTYAQPAVAAPSTFPTPAATAYSTPVSAPMPTTVLPQAAFNPAPPPAMVAPQASAPMSAAEILAKLNS